MFSLFLAVYWVILQEGIAHLFWDVLYFSMFETHKSSAIFRVYFKCWKYLFYGVHFIRIDAKPFCSGHWMNLENMHGTIIWAHLFTFFIKVGVPLLKINIFNISNTNCYLKCWKVIIITREIPTVKKGRIYLGISKMFCVDLACNSAL